MNAKEQAVADNGQNGQASVWSNPTFIVNLDCVPPASKQTDVDGLSVDSLFSSDEQQPLKAPLKRSCKKRQPDVVYYVRQTRYCSRCARSLQLAGHDRVLLDWLIDFAHLTAYLFICVGFLVLLMLVLCVMKELEHDVMKSVPGNNTCE